MSVVKSAASILAEIDDTKRLKGLRTARDEAFSRPERRRRPVSVRRRATAPEPRTQATPRDEEYYDNARAYRLAALEMGVHPLMPRDMYRKR